MHTNIGDPFSLSQNLQVSFSLTIVLLQVAGRSLGELVRKLGERVLPLIIPILSQGLKDPNTSRRQVRMFSCCYFIYLFSFLVIYFLFIFGVALSNKFSSYHEIPPADKTYSFAVKNILTAFCHHPYWNLFLAARRSYFLRLKTLSEHTYMLPETHLE